MKPHDLETFAVAPRPPDYGGRRWHLVKLVADGGIAGHGECYATLVRPPPMEAVIEDVFARHI